MSNPQRWVPRLGTILLVFLVAAAWPAGALGDSVLEASTPADGATVESPFAGPIVLDFTEPFSDESEAELLDAGGTRVASAATDPADASMRFDLESTLDPGDYVVRWTTLATDGHVARGSFGFTVTSPPPTPEVTPTPEVSATPAPATSPPATPEPSAVPTPSATVDDGSASGTADVLLPIIVVLIVVGAGAIYLLTRRSRPSLPG